MDSSLSEDEFQRMQLQLLELRTSNYQLEDQCKRKERELVTLRSECQNLDKDLQKANKIISKSKKTKEVELLVQDNDNLQMKLMSQEDDFRLQNQTLLQELNNVVTANEELDKQLKSGAVQSDGKHTGSGNDEVLRLQAQNTALQKNLTVYQEKYESEVGSLRQNVSDLEAQCSKLSGRRMTPVGENTSDSDKMDGQSDHDTSFQEDSTDKITDLSDSHVSSKSSVQGQLEEQSRHINELSLNLDTEREEKSLLLEKLQNLEKSSKEQTKTLKEEVDKLMEKFKKKQESFVQLQEEKEKMYTKLTDQIQILETSKSTEVKKLSVRSSSLQSDLAQCSQALDDLRQSSSEKISSLQSQVQEVTQNKQMLEEHEEKAQIRIKELENLVATLEEEVDEVGLEHSQTLVNELDQVKRDNHKLRQQNEALNKQINKLNDKLEESAVFHQTDMSEKQALQQDRDIKLHEIIELSKVAEKRKSLLDELAIKYQTATDQHREQTRASEEQYTAQVSQLTAQVEDLEKKLRKLRDIESKLEESQKQAQSLDNTKSWLERTLKETDELLQKTKDEYEVKLVTRDEEHSAAVEVIREEHQQQIEGLQQQHQCSLQELHIQIAGLRSDLQEKENAISKLKQNITDNFDDKKIHEKKGMTVVKDLKKQYQAERRRADKLQERLQEYLQSDNRSRTSVEELLRQTETNDRYHGDGSSVGSWSTGLHSSRDSSHVQSPVEEDISPGTVDQEHTDLLARIASLQGEKWTLETKVAHLESSNSAMCDDLLGKTAVIEHYVMNSKTGNVSSSTSQDKLSLKHVIDFVKNKGDEDMREMNRKLQAILEETLTKNMHLENDMETLSQELVRLSKQAVPLTTAASQPSNIQKQPSNTPQQPSNTPQQPSNIQQQPSNIQQQASNTQQQACKTQQQPQNT